jgi:hypothetical protein
MAGRGRPDTGVAQRMRDGGVDPENGVQRCRAGVGSCPKPDRPRDVGRSGPSKSHDFCLSFGYRRQQVLEMNIPDEQAASGRDAPSRNDVSKLYVAFCDVLGFSNRIMTDFDRTLDTYHKFGEILAELPIQGVEVTMYSDAVIVVGESLEKVLSAVQSLWFVAMAHDLMLRGAITQGRYWQLRKGNHLLIASDALVRAVKLEHSVGVPAVFIADDIEIPDYYWRWRFAQGLFITPLLHFRDRNIVNPFNSYWFRSAGIRATKLMAESPSHRDKYLWFLALHEAVNNDEELVPAPVLKRFLSTGVLARRTIPQSEQSPGGSSG